MKTLILIVCVIVWSTPIFSQSELIEGNYQLEHNGSNADLKRTLILNGDGTFLFQNYEYHEGGIPPKKNSYAKGTWTSEKKIIYFSSYTNDLDEKHTLDFTNSKARFIIKSPRDKSTRVIKTAIKFYTSDIFWIKGMTLLKD